MSAPGSSGQEFNWIAIGTRAGFEDVETPEELLRPDFEANMHVIPTPKAMFRLGQVRITRTAASTLLAEDVFRGLSRHVRGDWGLLASRDRHRNESALARRGRLVSVYRGQQGSRFYVITDPGWQVTTVSLPADV